MGCKNCISGKDCQFHTGSKLATGLQYSKSYRVFDLRSGTVGMMTLRAQERKNQPYIEIEEKTATCTKCRRLEDCHNYFVTSRSGGANVCICKFCEATQYANETELWSYVKAKLLKRYSGTDMTLRRLLQS